jgi:hypothetical protein
MKLHQMYIDKIPKLSCSLASSLNSSMLSVVSAHAASSVNNMEKSVSGS